MGSIELVVYSLAGLGDARIAVSDARGNPVAWSTIYRFVYFYEEQAATNMMVPLCGA